MRELSPYVLQPSPPPDQGGPAGFQEALVEEEPHLRDYWRVLHKHQIQLQRRRSWCISTDSEFGPKAADVVGLYLNPPENALLLSVDEKPHIKRFLRQLLTRPPGPARRRSRGTLG